MGKLEASFPSVESALVSCAEGIAAQNGRWPSMPGPNGPAAITLYRALFLARTVDQVEMELVNRGEGFFHVGGAGHESSAALAAHLKPEDWLHLHYRDKALMIARGLPLDQFFHSLLCTNDSHSAGRQMSAHLSAPDLHLLSLVGPVGNNALQAAGVAHEIRTNPGQPLVVCSVGDGTSQQGEFLEAIAEAVRCQLPVLFWIEDNRLAISTCTRGKTFYDLPGGPADTFYGLHVHRIDGRQAWECRNQLAPIIQGIRSSRGPALVVLDVDRLTHHTNADDERTYRSVDELKAIRSGGDPVLDMRDRMVQAGCSPETLEALEEQWTSEVRAAAGPLHFEPPIPPPIWMPAHPGPNNGWGGANSAAMTAPAP